LSTPDSKIAAKYKNKNKFKSREIKTAKGGMIQIKITIIFNHYTVLIKDRIKLKAIKAVFKYKISMRKMEKHRVNLINQINMETNIKLTNFKMCNRIIMTAQINR
jgi:hypothetical protein